MSRILLATDGSPGADEAVRLLVELRPRPEDVIHVLCATEHALVPPAGGDRAEQHASQIAGAVVDRLRYAGCAAITEAADAPAAGAIAGAAARIRADLIVLGSRGRGRIAASLLGSTARAVIHATALPTLVVRGHPVAPRWILLASADLRGIRTGARALARLPWPAEAAIDVLVPAANGSSREVPHLAEAFEEATRAFPGLDVRVHAAGPGPFADEVHRYADRLGADLVVLSLGDDGPRLADDVVGASRCPVLVVPIPTREVRVREPAADLAVAN